MKRLRLGFLVFVLFVLVLSFPGAQAQNVMTFTPPREGEWFVGPPLTVSHTVKDPRGKLLMGKARAVYCSGIPFTGTLVFGGVDPLFVERSKALVPYPADAGLPRGYAIREVDLPLFFPIEVAFEGGIALFQFPVLPFGEPRIHLAIRVVGEVREPCMRLSLEDVQRL